MKTQPPFTSRISRCCRLSLWGSAIALSITLPPATGQTTGQTPSPAPTKTTTRSVPTSPHIEQQTLPNCWMHATTAWIESLRLRDGHPAENFSESYLLYRHLETQLLLGPKYLRKLQTGARWQAAAVVISKYGLMYAEDFIPDEATNPKPEIMPVAIAQIQESLESGKLSRDRSPATIRAELDRAFGITLADLEAKIIPADQLVIDRSNPSGSNPSGSNPSGSAERQPTTLQTALETWKEYKWPYSETAQAELLERVAQSLNQGWPVPLSWFVDFGARSEDGVFSLNNLEPTEKSRQGGHLVVLVERDLEGSAFIAKNSWGETGYAYRGSRGFLKIETDYLTGSLQERFGRSRTLPTTGASSFILPPLAESD